MVRRVMHAAQSWPIFWLAGMYLAFRTLTALWPAGWWLEVDQVSVFDGVVNAEIIMDADRVIHRHFVADWAVLVRGYDGGAWVVWCTANGTGDYRPDAALPDPLTLNWWTGGQCETPPPGRYLVSTVWTIRGGGGMPDKVVQSLSNAFEISAP